MTTAVATREELKARACARIDAHRDLIVGLAQAIYADPEIGYREHNTSRRVAETFDRIGVPYQSGLAMTGLKGELRGAGGGPSVAIMGELDA
ncbi:MAG: amidohydrolase, partial [Dehalococcoidia bacterium]